MSIVAITKAEQIRRQYDAVARLARTVAELHEESLFSVTDDANDALLDIKGRRSAYIMEMLGDIINGMDAAVEEDRDLDPVFEMAHAMFPSEVRNS